METLAGLQFQSAQSARMSTPERSFICPIPILGYATFLEKAFSEEDS
ncbi:MAG: hypothetical protein ACJAQ8_000225 [Haliea salexigens]|jgi:hypothetical protein